MKVGRGERERKGEGKGKHMDEQISKVAKVRTVNEFASRPNFGGKNSSFWQQSKVKSREILLSTEAGVRL